jgi:hypothetical protein
VPGLKAVQPLLQLHHLGRNGGGHLQHRLVPHRRGFLRQKTEGGPALQRDRALVGRVLAQDQREQRGLARAVGPHQAQAVAAVHLQRGVLEQHAVAEGLG